MSAGAAAAAAIAEAIKASGVCVHVSPEDFLRIISKADKPLVVWTMGGVFSKSYKYLTSYKGFAFYTKSKMGLDLSPKVETVMVEKIWMPG